MRSRKLKLRRALHTVSAGALTGALLLSAAPTALAASIREQQWPLPAFGVQKVWQKSTGKGVTVAVVDTGVDGSLPDLKGQVLKGKDFTGDDGDGRTDTNGHGSGLASVIAGHGHGSGGDEGVMGLAPDAKILPVRYLEKGHEEGASWDRAVRWAVDHGADVINISQGGGEILSEKMAIKYALKNDVVVVAASGNDGTKHKRYPAAYPGVVAVGGLDDTGHVWDDSSWGSQTTFIAPAVDIPVADPTAESGYSLADGTSVAAAYVSAAAALVRSKYPDLSQGQVINRLVETAKPLHLPGGEVPELPDEKFGYGVIRPNRALNPDVPNGPKAGPLEQPASESSKAASSPADEQSASDEKSSSSSTLVYVLVGLGVLVMLMIIAFLVVKKNKGGGNGPHGPAGGTPPMPHQGQPHYPASSGQFGPPPPNQPPRV